MGGTSSKEVWGLAIGVPAAAALAYILFGPDKKAEEEELVRKLSGGEYKNIVIMCGPGISVNAGIPDIRSPSALLTAGLYFKLRKYNLPYPGAVLDGGYFRQDPKPFYGLIREIFPETLSPTRTHKFFSLLHEKGYLKRVYTENIDALEVLSGIPPKKIIEAHGSFQSAYCTQCRKTYDLRWLKQEIFSPETNDEVPKCDKCQGVVRPNVVLFGESLPGKFWRHQTEDFSRCDLLLVFGTSLVVGPFNSLVDKPKSSVSRCYINKTKPGASSSWLGWALNKTARIDFSKSNDLILLGDADETVTRLCEAAGWGEDLARVEVETLEDLLEGQA